MLCKISFQIKIQFDDHDSKASVFWWPQFGYTNKISLKKWKIYIIHIDPIFLILIINLFVMIKSKVIIISVMLTYFIEENPKIWMQNN